MGCRHMEAVSVTWSDGPMGFRQVEAYVVLYQ
jgi:hypothetical protein